jgi:hypothetical protein
MRVISALSCAAGTLLVIGSTQAAFLVNRNGVTWAATYEGDVSPPTGSTPAWSQFDTQGAGANQSTDGDLYTVNTTGTSAAVSYGISTDWSTGGLTRTAEIRTRVLPETYEAGDGAAGIVLGINGVAFNLRFHTGFVTFNTGALSTAATLDTSQFHTYRMIVDLAAAPNFSLFIDGNPAPAFTSNSSWFFSSGFDTVVWGDFSTGGLAGHTETDYISWTPGSHPPEVPEPAGLALISLGAAVVMRCRK